METQFFPCDFEWRFRDKFASLRQITSVSQYADQLRSIFLHISISESEKNYKFVSGLKPDIRRLVRASNSSLDSFDEAVRRACAIDIPSDKFSSKPKEFFAQKRKTRRFNGNCFKCGKFGHKSNECRVSVSHKKIQKNVPHRHPLYAIRTNNMKSESDIVEGED